MTSRTCPLFLATSACLVGFGGSLCHAQWSDDAALNTPLITAAGEQAQPKIARTADGGAYISWFDNRTGGYDVYLQRIDADGQPQWQADGILVADRSFSSTDLGKKKPDPLRSGKRGVLRARLPKVLSGPCRP